MGDVENDSIQRNIIQRVAKAMALASLRVLIISRIMGNGLRILNREARVQRSRSQSGTRDTLSAPNRGEDSAPDDDAETRLFISDMMLARLCTYSVKQL